jgi:hypothetical protein
MLKGWLKELYGSSSVQCNLAAFVNCRLITTALPLIFTKGASPEGNASTPR